MFDVPPPHPRKTMNRQPIDHSQRNTRALLILVIALGLIGLATQFCHPHMPRGRAAMAQAVSNGRQIKLILDSFAMDNGGHYPNLKSADFYGLPAPESSNDYFRQLFAYDFTSDEQIFWIKDSQLCNKQKPDNVTTGPRNEFSLTETLRPGDNGWAYILHQTKVDNPSRPLLVDSPPTASGLTFDPDLWDKKTIVLRIDGSATTHRLSPDNKLLDPENNELLTPASQVWDNTPIQIAYPE